MRRRDFIAGLGAAASLPLGAHAQERMRRVGVLMNMAADDPEGQAYMVAFQQRLQSLGWTLGRNVIVDYRWASGNSDRFRQAGAELVALKPDVVVAAGVLAARPVGQNLPIVFSQAIDPVGAGVVASLARPGGNVTGFMQFEYSLSGKWLQLLKELAPGVTRVGVLREPASPAGIGQWAVIQAASETLGVELAPLGIHGPDEIERGIAGFARNGGGGLIVTVSSLTLLHRKTIIASAARHRLPAVYPYRFFAADGGLLSYGSDLVDQYRRTAEYVDRILKGEKPSDLPVQKPTKYLLTLNFKTAKDLSLTVPPALQARADEVIE
jgi:putative tryptophan/tyrosine transport system substrate-binding protein